MPLFMYTRLVEPNTMKCPVNTGKLQCVGNEHREHVWLGSESMQFFFSEYFLSLGG